MTTPTVRPGMRSIWGVLLLFWVVLAGFWLWSLLARGGDNNLYLGSLALALGGACLALHHIDAARRRVWLTLAMLFIGASFVPLILLVRG